jgi:hypothetical protein
VHKNAPKKQREGSHQVLVIWKDRKYLVSNEVPPELHVIIYQGESPSEEERIAFQLLLHAVQRLQWLTREL